MRLYEVTRIKPGSMIPVPENRGKIEGIIRKYCSEALDACRSANAVMLRGINPAKENQFIGSPREDRIPSSSDPQMQIRFDYAAKEAGFTALRSNSLFVTSDQSDAEIYSRGEDGIYIIFPINGFTFTWSSRVKDFYTSVASEEVGAINTNETDASKRNRAYYLVKWKYSKENLDQAIKSGNEILIHGRYIALRNTLYKDVIERLINVT
jgi:hypothetical protein